MDWFQFHLKCVPNSVLITLINFSLTASLIFFHNGPVVWNFLSSDCGVPVLVAALSGRVVVLFVIAHAFACAFQV